MQCTNVVLASDASISRRSRVLIRLTLVRLGNVRISVRHPKLFFAHKAPDKFGNANAVWMCNRDVSAA